jgi:hypothetical protein
MTAILMLLMPSCLMVASSWLVIWKPPSPQITQIIWSGQASAAPSAAGTAKPMVPEPPLVMWLRGLIQSISWAAHI